MTPTIISRNDEAGTVTISRADFQALVDGLDDAEDLRSVQAVRAKIERNGIEAHRASCLVCDEVRRMLDGESVVRIMREKCGLTQAQLGDQADVATATVGMIETGLRHPSVSTLVRLARVLGVSTDDLLT